MRFFSIAAFVAAASLVAADTPQYKKMTAMGCYNSSQGLTFNDTYTFQSSGWCQKQCVPLNKAVMGLTASGDCWCGDTMPPLDSKTDSSNCNAPCNGWDAEMCGSADGTYFTVWNDGIKAAISNYGASTSSDDTSSTTSATPSVVTVGGQTSTIFANPTSTNNSSKSGSNKAAVAAGVVVGLVAIAALVGAAFFFMRRKQRREEEDEAKRQAAINSFMSAGKPGSSAGMSSTDSRLDPTIMTRRMSDGSIMDNQDYSRRILKVTNA